MISTSLSPNTERDDVFLAFSLLMWPRRWRSAAKSTDPVACVEKEISKILDIQQVTAVSSGRTALFTLLQALGAGEGDEVILQAYTCVAVPGPILWVGAKPVYVDCGDDLTLDIDDLKRKITKKTKAIIVQHTFGRPAKMREIMMLARERGIFVIEDCAHALGGTYNGMPLGSLGNASFFSFGRDKCISSTFGGAIVVKSPEINAKIRALVAEYPQPTQLWVARQLLHPIILNVAKKTYNTFSMGKILLRLALKLHVISRAVEHTELAGGKPSFVPLRFSPSLAVLALHQLEKLPCFIAHRRECAKLYREKFTPRSSAFCGAEIEILPYVEGDVPLRFTIFTENPTEKIARARKAGIELGDWYSTVLAPKGVDYEKVGYKLGSCPNAERLASRSLNLPTHIGITEDNVNSIVCAVTTPPFGHPSTGGEFRFAEISNQKIWNTFIDDADQNTFLDSWNWGEVEADLGRTVQRVGIYRDEVLVAVFTTVVHRARRGNILIVPHGPILSTGTNIAEIISPMRDELKKMARREKCVCVRIASLIFDTKENKKIFADAGFRAAPIHVYSELSWILDITPSEDELLKGMKKNTRYGIRKAEKDGVVVTSSSDVKDIEKFWKLYTETSERHGFVVYPKELIEAEFARFAKHGRARWYFAEHKGEVITTALITYSATTAFYHHGASSAHGSITPGEALQWKIIQDAKAHGLKRYNFWGVVPDEMDSHPWAGLSKFKKGFGGYSERYLRAQDLVISPKYWITFAIETVRRWKRKV